MGLCSCRRAREGSRRPSAALDCLVALPPPVLTHLPPSLRPPPRQTAPANLFLSHNPSLGPPYRVLVDTNFINHSLQNKLELVQGMMDCLFAKCASPPLPPLRRSVSPARRIVVRAGLPDA